MLATPAEKADLRNNSLTCGNSPDFLRKSATPRINSEAFSQVRPLIRKSAFSVGPSTEGRIMDTYSKSVRSFDHRKLAELPAYHRLRQALSDIANESEGVTLADFLEAVRDMALTTPYGDCCERCEKTGDDYRTEWPHAVHRDKGWLTGHYRCGRCGATWTCGYAVSFPELL